MRHLDLFAGIGGFSLAVDTVWHEEKNQHIFVEWDPFCTAVLKKHWAEAEYHKDIRQFVADTKCKGREWELRDTEGQHRLRDRGWENKNLTILTGGFPCQPFSHAGRRKGTADDRYLWEPMLECVSLFRPEWVIAENVRGLVTWNEGLVLETVCADLESEGYEVQPLVIPACAVGAPHRRDRVWIVARRENDTNARRWDVSAWSTGVRPEGIFSQSKDSQRTGGEWDRDWREVALTTCHDRIHDEFSTWLDSLGLDVFDTMMGYGTPSYQGRTKELSNLQTAIQSEEVQRKIGGLLTLEETPVLLEVLRQYIRRVQESQQLPEAVACDGYRERSLQSVWLEEIRRASDRYPSYRWRHHKQLIRELRDTLPFLSHETSHAVAEEGYRLWLLYKAIHQNSTPAWMDGVTISAARHRKERLKACGNAIVPQVAIEIMKAIKSTEHA